MIHIVTPEFIADGLCAQTDPEAYFVESGGSNKAAKAVCAGCEVSAECLDWALENNEAWGVWGGLTEMERRRVKRQRKAS